MKPTKRQNFVGKKNARQAIYNEMARAGVTISSPTVRGDILSAGPELPRGKLQTYLADTMLEISPIYKNAANAMMNPGHEGNALRAVPLPDGASGDVFVHKSIIRGTIVIPANDMGKKCQVLLTPFVEYPAVIQVGATSTMWGVADPKMCTYNGQPTPPQTYLRSMGVYATRCIGKSITIDNDTPELYRAGNITVCHMPSNVDNNNPTVLNATGVASTTNNRIVQNIPINAAEASMILSTANWRASEGVYAVSKLENFDFVKREYPWNKCSASYLVNQTPVNTDVVDKISINSSLATQDVYVGTASGWNTVDSYDPALSATHTCKASLLDNTDVVSIYIEGLNTSVDNIFKFKLVVLREFHLKVGSPLLQMAVPRPLQDQMFMEMLKNYADSLPGYYPADFNFWNELWNGFRKVIGRASDIWQKVAPVITPMLPPQARVVAQGVSGLNDVGRQILTAVGPGGARSAW